MSRFQKLQNRAARIATNSSFDTPSSQLIEKLGWKTVIELIDTESKTMIFNSLNEFAPPYLRSFLGKICDEPHIDYAVRQQISDYQKRYRKEQEILFV